MKNLIEINDIKLYAFHGCLEEEGKIGGQYSVDIKIETAFHQAALKDELQLTVDYVLINQIVKEEMAIRSKLIETVGYRIYDRIKKIPGVQKQQIKITKITPPINGDVKNVAIIIEDEH